MATSRLLSMIATNGTGPCVRSRSVPGRGRAGGSPLDILLEGVRERGVQPDAAPEPHDLTGQGADTLARMRMRRVGGDTQQVAERDSQEQHGRREADQDERDPAAIMYFGGRCELAATVCGGEEIGRLVRGGGRHANEHRERREPDEATSWCLGDQICIGHRSVYCQTVRLDPDIVEPSSVYHCFQ